VYLPREQSAARSAAKALPAPPRAEGTETILLVEDDHGVRTIAARILSAAGYTVLTASSGAEALLLCANHPGQIHLVLTDVVMPQMSGKDFVVRLAKVRPSTRVLYMSGYTDSTIVHQGVIDAGTHFIGKPFTQSELVIKVQQVLAAPSEGPEAPFDPTQLDPQALAQPITKEAVESIPGDIAQGLRRAAKAARQDEMIGLLDSLRPSQPETAWRLRQMVDAFDQDGLLAVLE
jgi:DNA-binding NtrC family response regulator